MLLLLHKINEITRMLRTKIKINKVNNLTDARYFAAMGVDYLGFCCNVNTEMYCAPSKIKEITDWVEGPEFVMEFDGWQSEEDIQTLVSLHMAQALHFGAFSSYTHNFGLPVFKDIILENIQEASLEGIDYPVLRSDKNFKELTASEKSTITHLVSQNKIFLDIGFDTEDLPLILDHWVLYGLILRGGDEEKTGFKSFEDLDDIFQILGA